MRNKSITLLISVFICCCLVSSAQTNLTSTANKKNETMTESVTKTDEMVLSQLNAIFIKNFVTMDTNSHNKIIHKDFICINSDGTVTGRKDYMEGWAQGYIHSGYTSFTFTDENIRIFGNMALVRSRTIYSKHVNGETIHGSSIYTDTYVKENDRWLCVQAHITPVKK